MLCPCISHDAVSKAVFVSAERYHLCCNAGQFAYEHLLEKNVEQQRIKEYNKYLLILEGFSL